MGLPSKSQGAVLLAGPSDYGLADPIQNTAYCLRLIDAAFLTLEINFENAVMSKMLLQYFDEIGEIAIKVQKEMELKTKRRT
jgi:hypothetical protein